MESQHLRKPFFKHLSVMGLMIFSAIFHVFAAQQGLAQSDVSHRDSVVKHLVGEMTASIRQPESEPVQIKMITCLVDFVDDRNSVFLYQEQGFIGSLDRPYRQRFLEITSASKPEEQQHKDLIFSHSYKPENLDRWTNFCQGDRHQDQIKRADLGQLICTIKLKPLLSVYVGQTPPGGCATSARGAATITNSIILHQQGMETWDRGFDRMGKQLWGARREPYQFFWDKDE